jgi:hypothetical protein
MGMIIRDVCPRDMSPKYKTNGHIHNGKQNHQCQNCGRQFVDCFERPRFRVEPQVQSLPESSQGPSERILGKPWDSRPQALIDLKNRYIYERLTTPMLYARSMPTTQRSYHAIRLVLSHSMA